MSEDSEDPMSTGNLAQALMIAIRVHAGQVDKQGEPYLLHVLRVVEAVSDEAKVVAALHDVLEDGYAGDVNRIEDFRDQVGLGGEEENAVVWLTRGRDETYSAYINSIGTAPGRQGKLAREVKLADLRDNLGRIPTETQLDERRARPDFGPFVGPGADPALHTDWSSLRARYEKAIKVLGAGVS